MLSCVSGIVLCRAEDNDGGTLLGGIAGGGPWLICLMGNTWATPCLNACSTPDNCLLRSEFIDDWEFCRGGTKGGGGYAGGELLLLGGDWLCSTTPFTFAFCTCETGIGFIGTELSFVVVRAGEVDNEDFDNVGEENEYFG